MKTAFWRLLKASAIVPFCFWSKKALLEDRYDTSQEIETSIEQMYLAPLDFTQSNFRLFELDSGSLGKEVAAHLDVTIGSIQSERFNDGECNLQVLNSVRGHNVYLIKGFGERNINDGVIELLLAVNTLKKEGAESVTCIIPYFPYSQGIDFKVESPKELFTCFASDVLKMLEDAGCNQVITFNSLMNKPKGFVNKCSFVNINAPDLFVGPLAFKRLRDPVLVSSHFNTPNLNNLHIIKNAMKYLDFDCPISTFNEEEYVGEDVRGRDVILYSNLMRTGNSFYRQSNKLKELGARKIIGCSFHSLCSKQQLAKLIKDSALKEIITTNSLPHINEYKKISEISLSRIIAELITISEQEPSVNAYRLKKEELKKQVVQQIKAFNKRENESKMQEKII